MAAMMENAPPLFPPFCWPREFGSVGKLGYVQRCAPELNTPRRSTDHREFALSLAHSSVRPSGTGRTMGVFCLSQAVESCRV